MALVTEDDLDAAYGTTDDAAGSGLDQLVEVVDVFDLVEEEDENEVIDALVPAPEERQPWERQASEPLRAFHGFRHFRDEPTHSVAAAYRTHKRDCERNPVPDATEAPRRWRYWSTEWGWRERAALRDADMDRQVRDKLIADQLEARQRHARLAKGTLTVLSYPVRDALEAASDPAQRAKLVSQVVRVASAIPAVVTMERLALGMTTESVEVEERRDFDIAFDNRILADPEAVELAIRLVNIGAGARPPLAIGSGDAGEPGEVAPDATPEPADEKAG